MRTLAICFAYDGSRYQGLQVQPNIPKKATIEGCLLKALETLNLEFLEFSLAARTDKGVHAAYQVAHLKTQNQRKPFLIQTGLNRFLPNDIQVFSVQEMPPQFHARRSALARHYRYLILNHPLAPLPPHRFFWLKAPLDVSKMAEASRALAGSMDFSSFRGPDCQSLSSYRQLHYLSVRKEGDYVAIELSANAFLQRMVRNIVGALLRIGLGQEDKNYLKNLQALKSRKGVRGGAPSCGLCLVGIEYGEFNLPPLALGFRYAPESSRFPLLAPSLKLDFKRFSNDISKPNSKEMP